MHELSVAQSLVELVGDELADQGRVRVTSVRLKLGPLSGVVAQALRSCYGEAAAGTLLEGSVLHIEEVAAAVFCARCDAERELADFARLRCPVCGAPTPEVVRGRELEVVSVEVADAMADAAPDAAEPDESAGG